jgi:hypothetical protein
MKHPRAEASSETRLSVERSLRVSRRSGGWNRFVEDQDRVDLTKAT